MHFCHASTFGLLRALLAPAKPKDKTYEEMGGTLTKHLAPKPIVIAERFRFNKRDQKEGEGISVCSQPSKVSRALCFW